MVSEIRRWFDLKKGYVHRWSIDSGRERDWLSRGYEAGGCKGEDMLHSRHQG